MDEKRSVTKAAGKISIATTISRILGFIRDVVLAKIFGATWLTDAFFIAYSIPNLLRELFAEGSVSAGYVPVFTEYMAKEGKEEAKRLAGVIFAFLLTILIIICFLGILLAPYIARLVAPNYVNFPERLSLTITLIRVMFPFLLFISLAALAMGTLNSLRSFFIPALAPAFFNVVMIASALYLAPKFSVQIMAVALGVTMGGAVQYAFQIPPLIRKGFFTKPVFNFSHPALKRILLLIFPVVTAAGILYINVLVSRIFANYMAEGSITYLYYGYRLILFPIGIFGISVATALLPSISEQASSGDIDSLRDTFSFALRLVFFTSIPAMAGLIALAEPIVNTLFQRGQFDYDATRGTVYSLIFYSSGIWIFSGLRIVRTVFFSMQDTITPLKVAVVTVFINAACCYIFMTPFKHGGLALALVIASGTNFFVLFWFLRKKLERVDGKKIMLSFIKTAIASLVMGLTGWYIIRGDIWTEGGRVIEKSAALAGVITLCVAIYLLIMYLMKSEELKYLMEMRKRKG